MSATELPGWDNTRRRDGIIVMVSEATGFWSIERLDHREPVRYPCCNMPFATERAAKLTCNVLYPLAAEDA